MVTSAAQDRPIAYARQVTASYTPDAMHLPATSAATEVDLPYPSTTTVSASTTAPTTGQSVTLTAKVSRTLDSDGHTSAVAGGGTVSFTDAGAPIAGCTAVALSPGTCTTSFATTGAHQVQAAFSGTSVPPAACSRSPSAASSAPLSTCRPRWSMPGARPVLEIAKLMRGSSSIHLA